VVLHHTVVSGAIVCSITAQINPEPTVYNVKSLPLLVIFLVMLGNILADMFKLYNILKKFDL
jgi:hypothetical protein